jgi:hypothetical protein
MENAMYRYVLSILCSACAALGAEAQDEPFAEVEILRGEHISKLSVFIVNPGVRDFEFPTGAHGRGGDVLPGETAGSSSGITVIPKLTFEAKLDDDHKPRASTIELQAPRYFRSWENRHDPKPEIFIVRAGKRRLYYSFKVPTDYVRGKFLGGYLPRPDIQNTTPGYGQTMSIGSIQIKQLIEITDEADGGNGAKKNIRTKNKTLFKSAFFVEKMGFC